MRKVPGRYDPSSDLVLRIGGPYGEAANPTTIKSTPAATQLTPCEEPSQYLCKLSLIGQMEAWSFTNKNVLPVGRKDARAAGGGRAVSAAPGTARPAERTAVERPEGRAGARFAPPGNPSPLSAHEN